MPITNTDLDKRLSLQEQELTHIRTDISDIKKDMKEHREESKKNTDKLTSKMDMLIWAIVIGMAGIVVKIIFF